MALDGIVIANIVKDFQETILGGRINKIAQPEKDELLLTIKNNKTQYRLLISAGASLPLIYLTTQNKPSPLTAPNFCMLLRKHIGSGKFTKIYQPGLERIIHFEIEHLNELGDLCKKDLIVEIMGKHSNIIFCDENGVIIDSIKHVGAQMSSVREVLPGRTYFIPNTQNKQNPFTVNRSEFCSLVFSRPMPLAKALYTTLSGISPLTAEEICCRSSLESLQSAVSFSELEQIHLYHIFFRMIEDVQEGSFTPNIIYEGKEPKDFSSIALSQYQKENRCEFSSISEVLESYYSIKNTITRIRQKSSDLRRVVQTALERDRKKYDLQLKQLQDTNKREKYRIYGELINTYGYGLPLGADKLEAFDYYNNQNIVIPLDASLTPQQNAQKNFDKYNKLKRTYEALSKLIIETKTSIEHLESISMSLDIALSEEDLLQIREELSDYGYIRKKNVGKKVKITSKPFHYLSSDGYHIYVGKNNLQNENLTFKFANGDDWWFHAKGAPGSHVIVKNSGNDDMPDQTFEEAARLAAYYSSNKTSPKVEIDYIQRKHVKKIPGGIPGFVIYHTNYSMVIDSDISDIQMIH